MVPPSSQDEALGLYDLSGNVWEWCYDRFGTVNKGEETDPTGAASGSDRVSRGGSWANYDASIASVFQRACGHPNGSSGSFIGFRVVRPSSN